MRICFVCLGNICRSPAAAAVFAALAAEGADVEIVVESAGTADYHVGEDAHEHTRAVAGRRGLAMTHRARQFVAGDFDRFDLVVAMDRANERDLQRLARSAADRDKVVRLGSFTAGAATDALSDVADPWGHGAAHFEAMFDHLDEACRALLTHVRGTADPSIDR